MAVPDIAYHARALGPYHIAYHARPLCARRAGLGCGGGGPRGTRGARKGPERETTARNVRNASVNSSAASENSSA
eukprot:2291345-Rhodomonas_salina.1